MLTAILFLSIVTTISSVPIANTGDTPLCERIQKNAEMVGSLELTLQCCEGPDCKQVENQECKQIVQEQLHPCFLNGCKLGEIFSDKEALGTSCQGIPDVCQALR